MDLRWSVRSNAYFDSVKLMRVSEALGAEPGVVRAAAVMATPLNIELLADDGLLPPDLQTSPDDLLITVLGEDAGAAHAALDRASDLLVARRAVEDDAITGPVPRTIERTAALNGANLALIAVPGAAAAAEAYAALRAGLHVFLFSDNVSIEDEVRLKALAAAQDVLMMGPDCGTAIVGGVGLGFANRVDSGPVGIVGASGTGIQQLCCLLDLAGVGIAQAIGTGGRDLSAQVGGSMTRRALRALDSDPEVASIAVVSKPADMDTTLRLHDVLLSLSKPVVACLLGDTPANAGRVRYTSTLVDAARALVRTSRGSTSSWWRPRVRRRSGAGRVYGLFTGGTLRSEATQVLDSMGSAHHLLDLGDDRYTQGRAHPMIDPRLRTSMLADLAERDDVGVVLLDVVLGDLAHRDPAGALLPGLQALRSRVPIVVTLVGARRDPQGLDRQRTVLEEAGALVFSANADAARAAGSLVGGTT